MDFWSRWHISLSSWLRDYIFYKLPVNSGPKQEWENVAQMYAVILGAANVTGDQTFASLGGVSLAYVQISLALEQYLGSVPARWESTSVMQLEQMKSAPPGF